MPRSVLAKSCVRAAPDQITWSQLRSARRSGAGTANSCIRLPRHGLLCTSDGFPQGSAKDRYEYVGPNGSRRALRFPVEVRKVVYVFISQRLLLFVGSEEEQKRLADTMPPPSAEADDGPRTRKARAQWLILVRRSGRRGRRGWMTKAARPRAAPCLRRAQRRRRGRQVRRADNLLARIRSTRRDFVLRFARLFALVGRLSVDQLPWSRYLHTRRSAEMSRPPDR